MDSFASLAVRLAAIALMLVAWTPPPAAAQGPPQEIVELRQRIAAIRANMAQVTEAADYAAAFFTRDPTARFLFSATRNPGLRNEFDWHTGASPEMGDADDPASRGIVVFPVSSWESGGLIVATMVEQWQAAGRPVIVLGSQAGVPDLVALRHLVPNGAPDGTRAHAAINEIANLITAWALYVEFVASATRQQWQPGIYVSHLIPRADDTNVKLRFHATTSAPVVPIAAGQLGNQYLDRVDSLLRLAARPEHQVAMQRAADSLRAARNAGRRLFAGACAHYLQSGLLPDTLRSPFRSVYAQYDIAPPLAAAGARPGDALLWFGYDGYDCPHLEAASPLQAAGIKVVVVGDNLPAQLPPNVMVPIALGWQLPEHIAEVPFNAEGVGSASSVDALVHYLWMKRLVGPP